MSTVLIAYASKHGATAEIAERIAGALRQSGLNTALRPVEDVDDPSVYDAVILGAAIYMGMWRRSAKRFLIRHQGALSHRPVWLFASGPTGEGDPEALVEGQVVQDALKPVIEAIDPRSLTLFHGRLDPEGLGWFERLVVKRVGAETGDFRDWEVIDAWAREIATSLVEIGFPTSTTMGQVI